MILFTKKEVSVLLFLLSAFLVGSGVRVWQRYFRALPKVEFKQSIQTSVLHDTTKVPLTKKTVDINTATREQLESIPGIGPVLAERIFVYRELRGKFQKFDDLCQVKGIGPKKLNKISKYLIIEKNKPQLGRISNGK